MRWRASLTRREAWIVRLPVRNLALLGGVAAAAAYAMLVAAALAWVLAARAEPFNTLLAALALILLFDPSAIASLSLWLSFAATAALLFWAGNRAGMTRPEQDRAGLLHRVLAAVRSLLWVSLLATLAALCALCGLDAAALLLMQLAGAAVAAGIDLLAAISELPAGHLRAIYPPFWIQLCYVLGMLAGGLLLWRGRRAGLRQPIIIMHRWCWPCIWKTGFTCSGRAISNSAPNAPCWRSATGRSRRRRSMRC